MIWSQKICITSISFPLMAQKFWDKSKQFDLSGNCLRQSRTFLFNPKTDRLKQNVLIWSACYRNESKTFCFGPLIIWKKAKQFDFLPKNTLHVYTAGDWKEYALHVQTAGCRNGYTLHGILLVTERDRPCTSILLAAEMDTLFTAILLVMERDTSCTSKLLAEEMDTPFTAILLVMERDTPCTSKLLAVERDIETKAQTFRYRSLL